MHRYVRASTAAASLVLVALVLAACGGSSASSAPSAAAPSLEAPSAEAPSTEASAAGGSTDTAATCTDVNNLKSLDYAFGAPFSIVQSLDDSSKALTLEHVTAFAAEAPPELQQATTDLAAVWTDLAADPSSVTESDPRLTSASQAFSDWLAANCQ